MRSATRSIRGCGGRDERAFELGDPFGFPQTPSLFWGDPYGFPPNPLIELGDPYRFPQTPSFALRATPSVDYLAPGLIHD